MDEIPPSRCLELFDSFDLDDQRERRLATYALEDYFGTVLAEVGANFLEFTSNDTSQGIGTQWNKAKQRIKTIDSINIPDRYNRNINRFNDIRNDVSHRYVENPSKTVLIDTRDIASEWATWIIDSSEDYHSRQEEISARDAIEDMARDAIESAVRSPGSYSYEDLKQEQESVNQTAADLKDDFDNAFVEGEEVNKRLVYLVSDAIKLEWDSQQLQNEERKRLEHEERERFQPATRCLVIESYDPDYGIHICTHEPTRPDDHYWIRPSNCPDEVAGTLKELETDSEIRAVIKTDRHGTAWITELR